MASSHAGLDRALASLLALASLVGCDALDPVRRPPGIPDLPAPAPLGVDVAPLPEPFRIIATDVRFRTRRPLNAAVPAGVDVALPRVEAVAVVPRLDEDYAGRTLLNVRRLRLVEPRVIFPPDTVVTVVNLFFPLFEPGVAIDRFIIEDGEFGTLAAPGQAPGRWFWHLEGVDLTLEDVRLGDEDGLPERFEVARFGGAGEVRGRPLEIESVMGSVVRTERRLTFGGAADLGLSRLRIDGRALRAGGWAVDIAADTVRFAELRAIARPLPEVGTGEGVLRIRGENGVTTYTFERVRASVGRSLLALRGTVTAARTPALDDVVLDLEPLYAEDLEAIVGVESPLAGRFEGEVRADGGFRAGVGVRGRLVHTQPEGGVSRVAVGGIVRLQPSALVDLNVTADPLTAGGRAYDLAVNARGPPDSLVVVGNVFVTEPRPIFARVDALVRDRPDAPPRLTGTALLRAAARPILAAADADAGAVDGEPGADREPGDPADPGDPRAAGAPRLDDAGALAAPVEPPIRARATGSVVLAETGAVDVRVVAEELPLALLPFPPAIQDVRGVASGAITIGGTVAAPTVAGLLRLRGGGFRVPAADLRIAGLAGPIRFEEGVASVDRLRGRIDGGELVVAGTVDPVDGEGFDLAIDVTGAVVGEVPEGDVLANADLAVVGPLEAPRLTGRIVALGPPAAGGVGLEPRAVAEGAVVLTVAGEVDVRVEAEELPLATIPFPAEVERVTGFVEGAATVSGTLADPVVSGRFRVVEGGLAVPRYGLVLADGGGVLLLRRDALVVPRLEARAGEGAVVLRGRIAGLFDEPRLDLTLELDSARVMDTDSAEVTASGEIALFGPVARPRFEGRIALVDGWVREDLFRPAGPLDPDAPPYAELAREVPWPEDSRLLAAADDDEAPPVQGELIVEVTPGFHVIDEDSDLFGEGEVRVAVTEEGVDVTGRLRVQGGFYAFFGERFDVVGGVVDFPGGGRDPEIGLVAVHEEAAPLGGARGSPVGLMDRFPPLEFFAHGSVARPREELRRPSLLPESQEELAALLIYDLPPMPVTGWRQPLFWRATEPDEFFGERAEAQAIPLAWSYAADEAYDYLPLSAGRLQAGTIRVGPRYPSRLVVGAVLRAAAVLGPDLELIVSQPFEGSGIPGVRARLQVGERVGLPGDGFVEAFVEPRFFADAIGGRGSPGFFVRRRIGVGAGWAWRY